MSASSAGRTRRTRALDLAAVVASAGAACAVVFVPSLGSTPLRPLIGVPFVLFGPGYALVCALVPERAATANGAEPGRSGLDALERVVLAFGLSLALVVLAGIALAFTVGLRARPLVVLLTAVAVVASLVALVRRRSLRPDRRYEPPTIALGRLRPLRPTAVRRRPPADGRASVDLLLDVALVVALVVAAAAVGYAATASDEPTYTELSLLPAEELPVPEDSDADYELAAGQPTVVSVGVGNREGTEETYAAVVVLERLQVEDGGVRAVPVETLDRFEVALDANESTRLDRTVTPTETGDRMRLTVYLYRGAPPETPSPETAYREVHLSVRVAG